MVGDTHSSICKMGDQEMAVTSHSSIQMAKQNMQSHLSERLKGAYTIQDSSTKRGDAMDKESIGKKMEAYTLGVSAKTTGLKANCMSYSQIILTYYLMSSMNLGLR